MKQALLILVMALTFVLPSWALKKEDILFRDGVEAIHQEYNSQTIDSLYRSRVVDGLYYYDLSEFWGLPSDSCLFYVDYRGMRGLMDDNFGEFYHGTEIGDMSPLKRQSGQYAEQFKHMSDQMKEIRQTLKNNPSHKLLKDIWGYSNEYDLENEQFVFKTLESHFKLPLFDNAIHPELKSKGFPGYHIEFYVPASNAPKSIVDYFEKEEEHSFEYRIRNRNFRLYKDKLKVPIKNKDVALAIEDSYRSSYPQCSNLGKRFFDFFVQFVLKESDAGVPYFEVTDIILLYNPTQEVVWTAMTGDHSNEVHLQN